MSNSLKATRTLVRHLLESPFNAGPWTLQGFGMLRLYLPDDCRLHIWSDDHRVVNNLHDHPWGFTSLIVSGHIVDEVWAYSPGASTHLIQEIQCGQGGGIKSEPSPISLTRTSKLRVDVGGSYTRTPSDLHQSNPSHGCVSLIRRTRSGRPADVARVAVPLGQTFEFVEPRPATESEVQAIVSTALEKWAE